MTVQTQDILDQALNLSPVERAELIEKLFASFDFAARDDVDSFWAVEAEDRIDVHDQGQLQAISADEVFKKID